MILAVLGVLVLGGGFLLWFIFHGASLGEPCMVSRDAVWRNCSGDGYCVNANDVGDSVCMTEYQAKDACRKGLLCKQKGRCDFSASEHRCTK